MFENYEKPENTVILADLPAPHVPPPFKPGDTVYIWLDPSAYKARQEPKTGQILHTSGNSATIIYFCEGGISVRFNCPHVGDWRVDRMPQIFDGVPSGVWDHTDTHKALVAACERVEKMDELLTQQELRLKALEAKPKRAKTEDK